MREWITTLQLDDGFAFSMRQAAAVAQFANRRLALDAATWEPHDWSEWEA